MSADVTLSSFDDIDEATAALVQPVSGDPSEEDLLLIAAAVAHLRAQATPAPDPLAVAEGWNRVDWQAPAAGVTFSPRSYVSGGLPVTRGSAL